MTTRNYLARLCAGAALFLTPSALAQEAAPAPAAATPAPVAVEITDADPALWVVRDADTTIYLFGTVHVLKPGLTWFDEAVKAAFDASDELKIEVELPEDTSGLAAAFGAAGTYPAGTTLTSRLSEEQRAVYAAALQRLSIPPTALDAYEPWLVTLQLSLGVYTAMGFAPGSGAEAVLTAAANAANKPVSAFETAEQQLGFLDSTPESEQIAGLLAFFEKTDEMRQFIDRLVGSWAEGRPDVTGSIVNAEMTQSPETLRILFTDRNRRWADSIAARMDQPGTVFVAVGAGHLAGTGSVRDFLAERGLTVERVAY